MEESWVINFLLQDKVFVWVRVYLNGAIFNESWSVSLIHLALGQSSDSSASYREELVQGTFLFIEVKNYICEIGRKLTEEREWAHG